MIPMSKLRDEVNELDVKFHNLPKWMPMAGITFGRHVFLQDGTDYATVFHELVHVRQQRDHFWKFWFQYLLFPLPIFWSWRYKWEAPAYARDVKYGGWSYDEATDSMCGSLYLWPCRRRTAFDALYWAVNNS